MSFHAAKSVMVDHVLLTFGVPVCVDDGSMTETITGVYNRNSTDYQVGELVVGGTSPAVRLYNSDLDKFCLTRSSKVMADERAHTVVLPIRDLGDGTSILALSEVKA